MNKIYKFEVHILFKDSTQTQITTYDDIDEAENVLDINDGCYVVLVQDKDLKQTAVHAFPISNNIKEMIVVPEGVV